MIWYEHLLGILAVIACSGYVLAGFAYAALRSGGVGKEDMERHGESVVRRLARNNSSSVLGQ